MWVRIKRWLCRWFGWFCDDVGPAVARNFRAEINMGRAICSWSQPVEREGGVPFDAASELASSEIRMSADDGATWSPPAGVAADETQFIVENLAVGAYEFQLVHIDTDGRRSAPTFATGQLVGAPLPRGDFAVVIEE